MTWAKEAKDQKEAAKEKDSAKDPSTGVGSVEGSITHPAAQKEKEKASLDGSKDLMIGAAERRRTDL